MESYKDVDFQGSIRQDIPGILELQRGTSNTVQLQAPSGSARMGLLVTDKDDNHPKTGSILIQ